MLVIFKAIIKKIARIIDREQLREHSLEIIVCIFYVLAAILMKIL